MYRVITAGMQLEQPVFSDARLHSIEIESKAVQIVNAVTPPPKLGGVARQSQDWRAGVVPKPHISMVVSEGTTPPRLAWPPS